MFLKSVTLKGFKSFAETTVVDFDPGLTVVVGPNGTGKSNIVESIAWVLGSQSPTSMRSDQMQDVIFAGSGGRSPLGRAEVTLALGNEDGRLPVDFPEVAISRSLFRSGESSYAINGTPARLVDIVELLAAGGVGRHRHVIVSQGRIDAMLVAKPTERRAVLEEAAGVSAFRLRKDKALRRLAAAEDNLVRLGDQLREVRRQLKPLEEQAEAAQRHGDLAAELERIRLYVLAEEFRILNDRRRKAAADRRDLADLRSAHIRESEVLEKGIASAERRLAESTGVELTHSLERSGCLLGLLGDVERSLTGKLAVLEQRRQASLSEDVLSVLTAEAGKLRDALEGEDAAVEKLRLEIGRVEEEAAALKRRRSDFEKSRSDRLFGDSAGSDVGALEGKLTTLAEVLRSAEAEEAALQGRCERLQSQCHAASEEQELLAARSVEVRNKLSEASAVREAAAAGRRSAEVAESEALRQVNEARIELALWRSRAEALPDGRSTTAAGSPEFLASLNGLLGILEDLLSPEPGWEEALRAAVGELMSALVVEGADAAQSVFDALKQEDLGGIVLPVIPAASVSCPSVGEPLAAHVRVREDRAGALAASLIGDVAVVDDWRTAAEALAVHPEGVFVTRQGDSLSAGGWRLSSSTDRTPAGGWAKSDIRQSLASAESDLAEREREHQRAAAEAVRCSEAFSVAEADFAKASKQEAEVRERTSAVEGRAAALRPELEEITGRLNSTRTGAAKLRREVSSVSERLEERRGLESSARQARQKDDAQMREFEDEHAEVLDKQRALAIRLAEGETRKSLFSKRLEEIESRLEEHTRSVESAGAVTDEDRIAALGVLRERIMRRERALRLSSERMRALQSRLAELSRERLRSLETERLRRNRLLQEAADLVEKLLIAERTESELSVRCESLAETLHAQHNCDPASAAALPPPELPEGVNAQRRIREIERLLRRIGEINPLAEREYASLKGHHDFLSSQVEDVRNGKRELKKVIKAIDADIVKVFSDFYEKVAGAFEQCFSTLFEGGTGRLRLTDPDDPLESGVEIEASPRGKYMRRLALLSGGERSLTAMALVFALLRSQNSPFFVLDEVDAALDDANLYRFLRLTEEFRSEVQLLLISHQKRTMEVADCLLGVSMKPGGGSRVVSERSSGRLSRAVPASLSRVG